MPVGLNVTFFRGDLQEVPKELAGCQTIIYCTCTSAVAYYNDRSNLHLMERTLQYFTFILFRCLFHMIVVYINDYN